MLVTTHESLKMTYLDRFRIVKLSGELQEKFDLPEFICADPDGMPFPEGQAFYRWLIDKNACQPVTAHNYLKSILPFLTFLWSNSPSLGYIAPAEQIRNQIRDYLREKLGYTVRPHRNGNFTVTPSTICLNFVNCREETKSGKRKGVSDTRFSSDTEER